MHHLHFYPLRFTWKFMFPIKWWEASDVQISISSSLSYLLPIYRHGEMAGSVYSELRRSNHHLRCVRQLLIWWSVQLSASFMVFMVVHTEGHRFTSRWSEEDPEAMSSWFCFFSLFFVPRFTPSHATHLCRRVSDRLSLGNFQIHVCIPETPCKNKLLKQHRMKRIRSTVRTSCGDHCIRSEWKRKHHEVAISSQIVSTKQLLKKKRLQEKTKKSTYHAVGKQINSFPFNLLHSHSLLPKRIDSSLSHPVLSCHLSPLCWFWHIAVSVINERYHFSIRIRNIEFWAVNLGDPLRIQMSASHWIFRRSIYGWRLYAIVCDLRKPLFVALFRTSYGFATCTPEKQF